jgi:hypothetical protein
LWAGASISSSVSESQIARTSAGSFIAANPLFQRGEPDPRFAAVGGTGGHHCAQAEGRKVGPLLVHHVVPALTPVKPGLRNLVMAGEGGHPRCEIHHG